MADAMEPLEEVVQQEAPDELVGGKLCGPVEIIAANSRPGDASDRVRPIQTISQDGLANSRNGFAAGCQKMMPKPSSSLSSSLSDFGSVPFPQVSPRSKPSDASV